MGGGCGRSANRRSKSRRVIQGVPELVPQGKIPCAAFFHFTAHYMHATLFQSMQSHDVRWVAARTTPSPSQAVKESRRGVQVRNRELLLVLRDVLAQAVRKH